MAQKTKWNGILLGVGFALFVYWIASSGLVSQVSFIDTTIITPISDWIQGIEGMPEFFVTLTWMSWLVAGTIGAIVGLIIEMK